MSSENLYQQEKDNNIKEEDNPEEGKFDNDFEMEHNNESESEEKENVEEEERREAEDESCCEDEEGGLVFEEDYSSSQDQVKKLREKLKQCRQEKQDYINTLQRLRADFSNQRSKEVEEKQKSAEDAKDKVILDLLPIIDSFEVALSDSEAWQAVDKQWRGGVEQIYSQLFNFLEGHEVEQLNPLGEEFNPHYHEPISTVPTEEQEKDDKVVEVLQRGYVRGDRVVRPAKVNVGKYNE